MANYIGVRTPTDFSWTRNINGKLFRFEAHRHTLDSETWHESIKVWYFPPGCVTRRPKHYLSRNVTAEELLERLQNAK